MSLSHDGGRRGAMFPAAFDALRRAGIPFTLRKGPGWHADLPAGEEVDIWLAPGAIHDADRVLARAGFRHLAAPGTSDHRFYLALEEGRWLKIDAKIGPPALGGAPSTGNPASPWAPTGPLTLLTRLSLALRQRRPLSVRRLGPIVALLGPDGAGKGTILAALRSQIPVAVTVSYLGWRPRRNDKADTTAERRQASPLRECAFVLYQAARAWRRLLPGYAAAWRGDIVLLDRHPIEVLAIQPRRSPLARSLERVVFQRLVPRPDAMVLLDAPGRALFARKGEQTPALLEEWRHRYREAFVPRGAIVVSTAGSIDDSIAATSAVVFRALAARRRW